MKKTIFYLSLMATLLVSSFVLGSCSNNDEDEPEKPSNPLVGTWTVISTDDNDEESAITYITSLTFKDDGSIIGTWSNADEWDTFKRNPDGSVTPLNYYMRYTLNENSLRIDMGEDHPDDDSLLGTITFSGKNATYTYHWLDYYGEWEDDIVYTIKLKKQ